MSDVFAQEKRIRAPWADPWLVGAAIIGVLIILPVLSVFWLAANPEEPTFLHLLRTVLPRYFWTTLILMAGVGIITAVVGTGTAWLTCIYSFPGATWFRWALLLPLGLPAYVTAYALTDFFEYAGPVQTALRAQFGWQNASDYLFPDIRSLSGAILVLSCSLFPYVFLLARAAFSEQSGAALEVSRALGKGGFARFRSVGLPLARPAVAAGVAIALMETVNDYGTVDYFGVQTLTTGVFSVWLSAGNVGGAAQIALIILGLIVILASFERWGRRKRRFWQTARALRPMMPERLSGWRAGLAFLACLIPFVLGFLLPVGVMAWHATIASDNWLAPGLADAFLTTIASAGAAAAICVVLALVLVFGVRFFGHRAARSLLPVTAVGYATPGAVLGLGILIPLAAFDNALADGILALTGWDPGLMLTGTAAALVFAYVVRFFAIPQGAVDAALGRVPPSLPMAARSLGRSRGDVLRQIYLPLIRGSLGVALLLVFVDAVKELPTTLLLRPFGFETLSVRVHTLASLEKLSEAAPAALIVSMVGTLAVLVLARAERWTRA